MLLLAVGSRWGRRSWRKIWRQGRARRCGLRSGLCFRWSAPYGGDFFAGSAACAACHEALQQFKGPNTLIEVVAHVDNLLAAHQPLTCFGEAEEASLPIAVVVVVQKETVPTVSTLDRHLIVSTLVKGIGNAGGLLNSVAHSLDVIWHPEDLCRIREPIQGTPIFQDDAHTALEVPLLLQRLQAATNTFPMKVVVANKLLAEGRSHVRKIHHDGCEIEWSSFVVVPLRIQPLNPSPQARSTCSLVVQSLPLRSPANVILENLFPRI
mmetsp:Transcript_72642/g.151638  ORF Transcript_72642/g.151638 Transcript_72642/m.151638 type:complete len:266 (-) Transcript_72642:623-1420(-)